MLCMKCKQRESTGFLVHLCDECFDKWEAEVLAKPKQADISAVDPSCIYQGAGGLVPNHYKGMKIRETNEGDVRLTYVDEGEVDA